jgi:hypothetical protein
MRRNPKALRSTAFHEAGHAVVACLLGVPFRLVTIKPSEDSLGHVLHNRWPAWADPDSERYNQWRANWWFEIRTRISLAGQMAEAICIGRRPRRYSHSADDDGAEDLALRLCGDGEAASAWLHWLLIGVRRRLAQPQVWHAVEVIADELLNRKTISDKEAHEIAFGAMRDYQKRHPIRSGQD